MMITLQNPKEGSEAKTDDVRSAVQVAVEMLGNRVQRAVFVGLGAVLMGVLLLVTGAAEAGWFPVGDFRRGALYCLLGSMGTMLIVDLIADVASMGLDGESLGRVTTATMLGTTGLFLAIPVCLVLSLMPSGLGCGLFSGGLGAGVLALGGLLFRGGVRRLSFCTKLTLSNTKA